MTTSDDVSVPKVSIIMACHNAASFISEAIQSALNQTFTNFELIIIDDSSKDSSLEIINKYASADGRIKVYSTTHNLGAGQARNIGIHNAKGEWLAILDADDIFYSTKLEKQVALISSGPADLVLLGTGSLVINTQGSTLSSHIYPQRSNTLKKCLIGHLPFPPHSSLMYRRSAVNKMNGFNPLFTHAEDLDLWLRLSHLGSFGCLPEALVNYRVHESNVSETFDSRGYIHLDYATAASVCDLLRQRGQPDPSIHGDPALWECFLKHIANEVKKSGLVAHRKWKKSFKHQISQKGLGLNKYVSLFKVTMFHPLRMWRVAREHLDGNQLAWICLKAWLQKTKSNNNP